MIAASGWSLRPMQQSDVAAAIEVIEGLDEDDAEEAAAMYAESQVGHFVLGGPGEVKGVTGAVPIDGTEGAFMLAPTNVAEGVDQQWMARMIAELTEMLSEDGARKLFAELSDYIDPDEGDVYRPLRRALADRDFFEESRLEHFYDRDESQIMMGLRLSEANFQRSEPDDRPIRFTDIDEIAGTDGTFGLAWELDESADTMGPDDFRKVLDQVRQWEGRLIVIAFPTGLSKVDDTMRRCGLQFAGRLSDYYDTGVDQIRFQFFV